MDLPISTAGDRKGQEVHYCLALAGSVDEVLHGHVVVSFADGLYMATMDGRHPSRVGLARS